MRLAPILGLIGASELHAIELPGANRGSGAPGRQDFRLPGAKRTVSAPGEMSYWRLWCGCNQLPVRGDLANARVRIVVYGTGFRRCITAAIKQITVIVFRVFGIRYPLVENTPNIALREIPQLCYRRVSRGAVFQVGNIPLVGFKV